MSVAQYFSIHEYYTKRYGENTVIIMQVGAFYEIYEYDPGQADILSNITNNTDDIEVKLSLQARRQCYASATTINIPEAGTPTSIIGHALEISQLLHMQLTSKNKNRPHSINNPFMVGFPCPSYEDYRGSIIAGGFNIIRIDQKESNSDEIERIVTEISSPDTELELIKYVGGGHIVSIYIQLLKIQPHKNPDRNRIVCGMSFVDVSTGKTAVHEVYSKAADEIYPVNEIYRFITANHPNVVIINIQSNGHNVDEFVNYLSDTLELYKISNKIINVDALAAEITKADYQESFLSKVHENFTENSAVYQPGSSNISTIERLDLELLIYARISYIILLQYCYEHNENLIIKIQKPEIGWTDQHQYLVLTHNALCQLDILPKEGINLNKGRKVLDSVLSIIDMTSTTLGRRYLYKHITNPSANIQHIQLLYDLTDEILNTPDLMPILEKSIKSIPDIERLQRKIQIFSIRPNELCSLFKGYNQIMEIYMTLFKCCQSNSKSKWVSLLMPDDIIQDFNNCLTNTLSRINLEHLNTVTYIHRGGSKVRKMHVTHPFIYPGLDSKVDDIVNFVNAYKDRLNDICTHLNEFINSSSKRGHPVILNITRDLPKVKKLTKAQVKRGIIPTAKRDIRIILSTTPTNGKILKACTNINSQMCGQVNIQNLKKESIISSTVIDHYCEELITGYLALEKTLLQKYDEIILGLSGSKFFQHLNIFVGKLDFIINNAKVSKIYRYFKPQVDTECKTSYIQVLDMRHPLIERISRNEYIPNDLYMGRKEQNDKPSVEIHKDSNTSEKLNDSKIPSLGLLLYGVNSTGKTSLAKSAGVLLILAQSGMYVPGKMIYRPYSKIITRLTASDDIIGGKSSFIVEMSELRTILRNANENSLVLGDELCRGTETQSGTSLTVTTIEFLINKNSTFIFSTHMHHLPNIDLIKQFNNSGKLAICHLSAIYDSELEKLVYNRKFTAGSGSSLYGLEVCKSLSIDPQFISRANELRKIIFGGTTKLVSTKTSRYNTKIYVNNCAFCNSQIDLQTHHINEQSNADKNGFIGHYHKNSTFNLLVICKSCHDFLHTQGFRLMSKQTLEGTYLTPIV